MMSGPSRVIFLAGAPDASSLQWESGHLTTQLLPSYCDSRGRCARTGITEDRALPAWRYIPTELKQRPTGYAQIQGESSADHGKPSSDYVETSFLTVSSFFSTGSTEDAVDDGTEFPASAETDEHVVSHFYEQSFANHENIASSQIQFEDESSTDSADHSAALLSASFLTSFSGSDSFASPASPVIKKRTISVRGRICDLKDIPNASHIRSVVPQTITVNLVVCILSVSLPRSIRTKRWGREVQLVEMLVADETRAGFNINFWLPPEQPAKGRFQTENNLANSLGRLRRQDVVLIRNVALNAFMGKVYGQSLRKDMTTLDLLYRHIDDTGDTTNGYQDIDLVDANEEHPQAGKVSRVKEWVMAFVGSGPQSKQRGAGPSVEHGRTRDEARSMLPPDTQ